MINIQMPHEQIPEQLELLIPYWDRVLWKKREAVYLGVQENRHDPPLILYTLNDGYNGTCAALETVRGLQEERKHISKIEFLLMGLGIEIR